MPHGVRYRLGTEEWYRKIQREAHTQSQSPHSLGDNSKCTADVGCKGLWHLCSQDTRMRGSLPALYFRVFGGEGSRERKQQMQMPRGRRCLQKTHHSGHTAEVHGELSVTCRLNSGYLQILFTTIHETLTLMFDVLFHKCCMTFHIDVEQKNHTSAHITLT